MQPTRGSSQRQATADDRSAEVVVERPEATGRDIIRPSSMTRVYWRLTGDERLDTDTAR